MTATTDEMRAWEARAARDTGVLLHSYLLTHPRPPGDSVLGDHLATSAEILTDVGSRVLAETARRPLELVKDGA